MIKFIKMINEIATTEYFLTDALASVRQLTDGAGEITLSKTYNPYGENVTSAGDAQTSYGFTGEYTDSTGNIYLRARYYNPSDGRFLSRDTWAGDVNNPLSLNRWMYTEGNPVNYVDPTGQFSEEFILASLHGEDIKTAFGTKTNDVARWGLYNLLKDASPFSKFTLRNADFGYEGPSYPLAPDADGEWAVYDSGCDLVFVNNKWGFKTLPEFLELINFKSEITGNRSPQWWRRSTLQYHWYETNGKYYSDFYEFSLMPSMLMISGGVFAGGYGALGYTRDMYGNQYYSIGGGVALPGGFADHWEGYASINQAGNSPRQWRILSESELKNIILGSGYTFEASWITSGVGVTFNKSGTIAMYGNVNALIGLFGGASWTWEASTKDYLHRWKWVDEIPVYGPPQ